MSENDRRDFAQRLCLALRNVQVYGADHSVSASSLRAFYDGLVSLLDCFPEVDVSLAEGKVLLNGQPCELRMADDVLAQRMQKCDLDTFTFLDSVSRIEVNRFISWLATGADPQKGQEAYVGIKIADSVYARISRREQAESTQEGTAGSGAAGGDAAKVADVGGVKKFDLDDMLNATPAAAVGVSAVGLDTLAMNQHVNRFLAQQRLADEQRRQMIAMLQRNAADPNALGAMRAQFMASGGKPEDWAVLCGEAGINKPLSSRKKEVHAERDQEIERLREEVEALRKRCALGQVDPDSVSQELGKIRGSLDGLIEGTSLRTGSLVERINADRVPIAELEKQARESGAPIHLSREELLESLAEINQELAQPLTVSSALLDLLGSGRMGYIEPSQQELVNVATDGLARLEIVLKYLQRLSGVPNALAPDQGLLREVYEK
ncbi:MAG: hypothetical protein ACNA71_05795 [Kiritimatiellia bacterium]